MTYVYPSMLQMQYFGSTSQANTAQTGDEDEDGDVSILTPVIIVQ